MANGTSFEDAISIAVGGTVSSSVDDYYGEVPKRYFVMEVVKNYVYEFKHTGDGDLMAVIYDSQYDYIVWNIRGENSNGPLTFKAEYTGVVYAHVHLYQGSNAVPFQVTFNEIGYTEPVPGESFDNAIQINSGNSLTCTLAPADEPELYLVLHPTIGEQYVFLTHGEFDTTAKVYDSNFSIVDEDDDSGTDYNAKVYFVAETSPMYIRLGLYDSLAYEDTVNVELLLSADEQEEPNQPGEGIPCVRVPFPPKIRLARSTTPSD